MLLKVRVFENLNGFHGLFPIQVKATRWQHLPSVVGVHDRPYIPEVSYLS